MSDPNKVGDAQEGYEDEGEYYPEDEGEWEVEKIIGKRKNKETKEDEYRVLWAGFDGDTHADGATSWELSSWLEEEGYDGLIAAYAKDIKQAAAKKQAESEHDSKRAVAERTRLEAQKLQKEALLAKKQLTKLRDGGSASVQASTAGGAVPDGRRIPKDGKMPKSALHSAKADSLDRLVKELRVQEYEAEIAKAEAEAVREAMKQSAVDKPPEPPAPEVAGGGEAMPSQGGGFEFTNMSNPTEIDLGEEKPKLSATADFVNTFEGIFLRGGNLIEPTILRLLGSAQWDVKKAWNDQLAKDAERSAAAQLKEEERKKLQEEKEANQSEGGSRQKQDGDCEKEENVADFSEKAGDDEDPENYSEDDHEDGEEEEYENFFMIAPTTFHESADILLEIMSFSTSHDFFSACKVNKRWHHVGRKMSEARSLVRNFALGLQRSFSRCGVVPIALGCAGTPTPALKKLYRQARREMNDPKYEGANGGVLVPMYGLQVNTDASKDFGVKRVQKNYWGPVEYVSTHGLAGGTATLLDPTVPPVAESTKDLPFGAQEMTVCISVGRMPTFVSHGQGRVEISNPGSSGLTFGSGYRPASSTSLHYNVKHTHLVAPVVYMRVLFLASENQQNRTRLSQAVGSHWRSEVDRSIKVPEIVADEKKLQAVYQAKVQSEQKKQQQLLLNPKNDPDFWRKKTMSKEEILAEEEVKRKEEELELEEKARLEGELEGRKVEAGMQTSQLWDHFCDSLPPPKILWKSFAPVKPPACRPGDKEPPRENWFRPPNLKRGPSGGGEKKKQDQIVRCVLNHDETLDKIQLAKPATLIGKAMTDEQHRVVQHLTRKLWDHSSGVEFNAMQLFD